MMNRKKAALKGPISRVTSRPAIKVPPQNTAVRNNFSRTRKMGFSRKLDQTRKYRHYTGIRYQGDSRFIYTPEIVLQPVLHR